MCPGNAGASDLLARPPLPAASQWPSLACSTGNLPALLAGHDGGDDAGRKQERSVAVPLAFLAGYAVIWTTFAGGAFLGDTLVHRLVALWPWLAVHSWLIGAVTFFIAGLFQFSPLKEPCLDMCRTPLGFFMHHYRKGVGTAWQLGLRHGGRRSGRLLGLVCGLVSG